MTIETKADTQFIAPKPGKRQSLSTPLRTPRSDPPKSTPQSGKEKPAWNASPLPPVEKTKTNLTPRANSTPHPSKIRGPMVRTD